VKTTVFGIADGVRGHSLPSGYGPRVTKSVDGKIWFTTWDSISVVDPHHIPSNKLPPPVQIERVLADETPYDVRNGMRLPQRIRYLAIDYTALSLAAPEQVRFRYKLDGVDNHWREVVNDREVQYTNLAPGTYHFRVLACNNSGVWNEEGASLEFVIPPMWYQTNWFRASCVAAFLVLLWAVYQLRLRQLARQFNMRLEERVSERTRIARELHDTLLQGAHGLLLRFEVVSQLWADRPKEAKKKLDGAIKQTADFITEARDQVQGLRESTTQGNDLALAISTLGQELATVSANHAPTFRVAREGTARNLHPILRDEIYKIAAEALRNAFRQAQAEHIEVEIRYDNEQFRLRVRDDGKGIDSAILSRQGSEGHYGLPGMRERATIMGAKLTVWSEVDAGTEVEVRVPARNAYATTRRSSWFSQKFAGKAKA
jgi:signal transduction histidine kinase